MELIYCGRGEEWLESFAPQTIDMVLTSPPYDAIRDYSGFTLDMPRMGRGIASALTIGGVAVLVMQDQTKNGHKTLTTFRTAIDWCDNTSLGLFECLIQARQGVPGRWWNRRFRVDHEYVLVFVKGIRPAYFDKQHMMIPAKWAGTKIHGYSRTTAGGKLKSTQGVTASLKCPGTILHLGTTKDEARDADHALKRKHPATFSDKLARNLIQCFTQANDMVIDPMMGGGTTLVEATKLGRRTAGADISKEYVITTQHRLSLIDSCAHP